MIRKTVLALAAVATSAGTIAGSVVSGVNAPLAAAAAKSVVVPLSVTGAPGSEGGVSPMVEVRVGAAKPVPVVLDTGSSGLHLFDNAVKTAPGAGVSVTTRLSNITYAGGYRFAGVVASAVVTVGSQATAGRVPFSLVNTASCTVSKPTCRAAGGMAGFEAKTGADGILGHRHAEQPRVGDQSHLGDARNPRPELERAPERHDGNTRSRCAGAAERHDCGYLPDEAASSHWEPGPLERLRVGVLHHNRHGAGMHAGPVRYRDPVVPSLRPDVRPAAHHHNLGPSANGPAGHGGPDGCEDPFLDFHHGCRQIPRLGTNQVAAGSVHDRRRAGLLHLHHPLRRPEGDHHALQVIPAGPS